MIRCRLSRILGDRKMHLLELQRQIGIAHSTFQEGYAQVMTVPPNVKYQDMFLKLQREARENSRGLWKQ